MKKIEDIITDGVVMALIENADKNLTISELKKKIKIQTNGEVLGRKISEFLRRMQKNRDFYLEEKIVDNKNHLYKMVIVLSPQTSS